MTGEAKIAEPARQERAQGGRPAANSSGDPSTTAAGPHDKPELATGATEGSRRLQPSFKLVRICRIDLVVRVIP